ncbi:MAG TPA: response regulator, partial [Myxococcaceae bacterium]|nr:response regulator [Myxococcaceae bacterium]
MATREAPTILIVDDDRAIQRLLADALAQVGCSVAVERDGEWAIDTFNKRRVDAIVLDLLLPAINGYEVARIIRSTPRGRDTPIVMISGVYKSESQRKEAVEKHGAFAFIEKPIRLSALVDALRSALGDRWPQAQAAAQPEGRGHATDKLSDPQAQEEAGLVERHSEQMAGGPGIHGDFRQRPFPEVLAEIFHWRGTGALLLRRDKVKKIVYFRDGQPLSIKSNLLSECLGQVLVGERLISEAE